MSPSMMTVVATVVLLAGCSDRGEPCACAADGGCECCAPPDGGGDAASPSPVEIRGRQLYVNQQPVLPLGLWGVPKDSVFPGSPQLLPWTAQELRDLGINVLMPNSLMNPGSGAWEPVVEGLWRFVFIYGAEGLDDACQQGPPTDAGQDPCRVRHEILKHRDRPDVIGWFSADEPAFIKDGQLEPVSADALRAARVLARAADPLARPVWIDHAPWGLATRDPDGGVESAVCDLSSLVPYNDGLDVFSFWYYPIPRNPLDTCRQHNVDPVVIAVVGEATTQMEVVANHLQPRPLWVFLQGAHKNSWRPVSCGPPCDTRPTYWQQRFMAFDALLHGANGLFWYGVPHLDPQPGDPANVDTLAVAAVEDVVREIASHRDLWLGPPSARAVTASVVGDLRDRQNHPAVHFAVRTAGDGDHLVAVNHVEVPITVEFSENGMPLFTDALEPFGVHVRPLP